MIVTLGTLLGWIPGIIAALIICSREEPTPKQIIAKVHPIEKTVPERQERTAPAIPERYEIAENGSPTQFDIRTRFYEGMIHWLTRKKFQVGLPTQDRDVRKQIRWVKRIAKVAMSVLDVGTSMPMLITGSKIEAEKLLPLITPLASLSDLLGFRVDLGALLIPVISADDLATAEVLQRIRQIAELARPLGRAGVRRLGYQGMGTQVYLLLVYFDEQKYAQSVPTLMQHGILRDRRRILLGEFVHLYTGFINVPKRTVVWSEQRLLGLLKSRPGIFSTKDLNDVLDLAGQSPLQSR
jgi:hypothetical protein